VNEPAPYARLPRSFYPTITALFTATLIISNVAASKGVSFFGDQSLLLGPLQILPINTDGAFFLFPLAYVLGDVLSEVYGFRAARRTVITGFVILALTSLCFWITIQLPPAGFYENQGALEAVIGVVPRLVLAGLVAYLAGQLLNSAVLVWIKNRWGERRLWVRLISSTVAGEFVDTLIFCSIAAGAIGISTAADFVNYVIVGFLWKTLVEVLVMPITYRVIAILKRYEPTYAARAEAEPTPAGS